MNRLDTREDSSRLKSSDLRVESIEESLCPLDREDVILDAGTGRGYMLDVLSCRCKQVYAIDINIGFLTEIHERRNRNNVTPLRADLRKMPFKSSHFTKVVCTEVLEHLSEPLAAIQELNRVLKPGGIAVIALPTSSSEKLYALLNRNYNQNKGEHITILNKKDWILLFRKAGFNVFAVRNQNFQPAIYWVFRNVFPIEYDPASGLPLENRFTDRVFWFAVLKINKATFGIFDRIGKKIFPKSWYFYLTRTE
jgi:ubiquinone/menaquinone biosynthesis C-methylase UbiE